MSSGTHERRTNPHPTHAPRSHLREWPTERQRRWLLSLDVDFVANEGGQWTPERPPPLPAGVPVGGSAGYGLAYVITVRNPLDRVLSHYRHERTAGKLKGTSFATFVLGADFVHWRDSFYVRLLGGCGWKPTCSDTDTEVAVSALDYFSAVLISDDSASYTAGAKVHATHFEIDTVPIGPPSSSRRPVPPPSSPPATPAPPPPAHHNYLPSTRKVLLGRKLGWPTAQDPSHFQSRGTHVESRAAQELAAFPAAYAQLVELNRPDLRFHASARERFHADVIAALGGSDRSGGGDGAGRGGHSEGAEMMAGIETVGALDGLLTGGRRGEGSANDITGDWWALALAPPERDRSGFGGHTSTCKGLGDLPLDDCRRALVELRPSGCSALSYKDGECYLHAARAAGFYTNASPGHQVQMAL